MSDPALTIIDLPDLVQNLGRAGRSGVLQVNDGDHGHQYAIAFKEGTVTAIGADDRFTLYHALQWLNLMDTEAYVAAGVPAADAFPDIELAQRLLELDSVPVDGIRDAVDVLIEERFTVLLGCKTPTMTFDENGSLDKWMQYQANLGTAINANSLLMEGLRLQDELGRFGLVDYDDADIMIAAVSADPDAETPEGILLAHWNDREDIASNLLASGLPPSTARLALHALVNAQSLHRASVAELVILAEQLQRDGLDREREHILRRACALGAENPRIHLQLAFLAEHRRDYRTAAGDNLHGGRLLVHQNPKIAIRALNKAREFGANRLACLEALLACHKNLNDLPSACTILLQMADTYEKSGESEQAIQAVREAQEIGADPVACALSLARLQMNSEDPKQALMQLQSAAHLAVQEGRMDAAASAWDKILVLQPDQAEIALLLARHHEQQKERDAATRVIRACLKQLPGDRLGEQVIGLRELLARVDPEDSDNHQQLARIYQKRKDVDNAADQLLLVAQAQERNQQWHELTDTLQRIIAIDPLRHAVREQLAQTLYQLGYTTRSAEAWNEAIQTIVALGDLEHARTVCDTALEQHPANPDIHAQLAAIAFREANQTMATKHYQRAAWLSLGSGDLELAKIMLQQLVSLRPEDQQARQQLVQTCVLTRDQNVDGQLRAMIRLSMRANNLGVAVEYAYQRVLLAPQPAFAQRAELVELLRRCGRTSEELDEGQSLFQDLIEAGEFEHALELQQRLVASNSQNGELVMNLGEVFEALENRHQASRCYRLATVLFQQEGNDERTREMLQRLGDLTHNAPDVQRARDEHKAGHAINWEAIRHDLAAVSKQQIIDSAHSARRSHPGTDTYSQKVRLGSPAGR